MFQNKLVKTDEDGRPRDYLGNHASKYLGYPVEKDKGERGGSCNITHCQRPGATWINSGMQGKYYCRDCAKAINFDPKMILCTLDEAADKEYYDKVMNS